MNRATICEFPGCICVVTPEEEFHKDGRIYCCRSCADGHGCDHPDCRCSHKEAHQRGVS